MLSVYAAEMLLTRLLAVLKRTGDSNESPSRLFLLNIEPALVLADEFKRPKGSVVFTLSLANPDLQPAAVIWQRYTSAAQSCVLNGGVLEEIHPRCHQHAYAVRQLRRRARAYWQGCCTHSPAYAARLSHLKCLKLACIQLQVVDAVNSIKRLRVSVNAVAACMGYI
ncbi:hypothetical protein THASP1DRAFT_23019 [Thamnocephalis sphaerospora]|uniref:Uncharacterized protein n=1 Tax=Thamnocephalis sphaerospora TaxID=78915 RepID=A0A4P9XSJ1_9FUNG|nr:hypothetical protein THASP1DRAFT_23019 [Thamnocephalis sphaerospora]|eukprot:RKP09095.1 hypothetical protein THASP1DRAFT_23019 [Thamnocephalis sphaerospora]